MGKKHKKHKSDGHYIEDNISDKTPLKLVLKLGSEVMYDSDYAANSPASSSFETPSRKPKRKKKKKRHNEEHRESMSTSVVADILKDDSNIDVNAQSLPSAETEEDMEVQQILPEPEESPRILEPVLPKQKFPLKPYLRKALNGLLDHLLKQLERKDTHDVFAWPVNDMIAPGYSSVISEPMDFSTIRNKIITNQYFNVEEFKLDFDLMINNCCLYNKPDTVYYDIAKKVHAAGSKILSKERLKNTRRTLTFLHSLSKQELSNIFGLSLIEEEAIEISIEASSNEKIPSVPEDSSASGDNTENKNASPKDTDMRPHADAISFTDADNEDTVALDAIQAMKDAKKRLDARCPKNRIGFLRMDDDGKTTLNILNPDANEEKERVVDLGALTGSVASGFDVMPEPKEDKRNKVTPLQYLSYGPFGSYAPTYDSRISNLTQEESDLLLSAYGGDTGLLFARSLEEYVSDTNKGLIRMVGDILDTVTHGAHSSAMDEIQLKRNKEEIQKSKSKENVKIDGNEVKSLQDLGIDNNFLKEVETKNNSAKKNVDPVDVKKTLDVNSVLLKSLEKEQYNRLSVKPDKDEPNFQPPTAKEHEIATRLQQSLSSLSGAATPGDVCDPAGLRKAMGIVTTT